MKGDYTKSTFDPAKHYNSVRMQQGRVQMDADWNEWVDIAKYRWEKANSDSVGPCGAPFHTAGFEIQFEDGDLKISKGHYYVHGVLCENDADISIGDQPDYPRFSYPQDPGIYLAYLEVWDHHLTALEDSDIREVALGGPDTTTRLKTVWQVKLAPIDMNQGDLGTNKVCDPDLNCQSIESNWLNLIRVPDGQMRARSNPDEEPTNPCLVQPGGGYRGLENQLYRVEIHRPSTNGPATFKWSRENGSIVVAWERLESDGDQQKLIVKSANKDQVLGFSVGDWVEILDDDCELIGRPGILVQLLEVEDNVLTIDPSLADTIRFPDWNHGPIAMADFPTHPKIRRWDSLGDVEIRIAGGSDGYLDLEDGVDVQFSGTEFRTGDYWVIPARTADADVQWPDDPDDPTEKQFLPPHGIERKYCHLAILKRDPDQDARPQWSPVNDCRHLFTPLSQRISFNKLGGDGQELPAKTLGGPEFLDLPLPLRVGVHRGGKPISKAVVRFTPTSGHGLVDDQSDFVEVATTEDGVAECHWQIPNIVPDPFAPFEVTAELLGPDCSGIHIPVYFHSGLRVASQVEYHPGECGNLAGLNSVQEAIEALAQLAALHYVGGDGQSVPRSDPALPQSCEVRVRSHCGPIQGARVRFEAAGNGTVFDEEGNPGTTDGTIEIESGPDGIASCNWHLDPAGPDSQQLMATLTTSESPQILPAQENHLRFNAQFLESGVRDDPATRICGVLHDAPHPMALEVVENDSFVAVNELKEGFRVVCDRDLAAGQLANRGSVQVILEMPDNTDGPLLAFRPIILNPGRLRAVGREIHWVPSRFLELRSEILSKLEQFINDLSDGILARLIVKGNYIWSEDSGKKRYLDGNTFGALRSDQGVEALLPSGDGIRGGEFETWIKLVKKTSPISRYTLRLSQGAHAIANHLDHASGNDISTILGNVPVGTEMMKWDKAAQQYSNPDTFLGAGIGWIDAAGNPSSTALNPGEGAILRLSSAANIEFSGVLKGQGKVNLSRPGLCLLSRQVPGVGLFENITGHHPFEGVKVHRYVGNSPSAPAEPGSSDFVTYTFRNGHWDSCPPRVRLGEAVFVESPGISYPDPPRLEFVTAGTLTDIHVTYDQPVDEVSATDPFNFTVTRSDGGELVDVMAGTMVTRHTAQITVASPLDPETEYSLEASGVVDLDGNLIQPPHHRLEFTSPDPGDLDVVVVPPPSVVVANNPLTLRSIVTGGTAPYTFQWRFNGTILPGATSDVLTFPLVAMSDAGDYDLVVTDHSGLSATSQPVTLQVRNSQVVGVGVLETRVRPDNTIEVVFSGPVDESLATDPSNYSIRNATVTGVEMADDPHSVRLSVAFSGPRHNFTVAVRNVRGRAGETLDPNMNSARGTLSGGDQ